MPYTLEIGESQIVKLPSGEVAEISLQVKYILTRQQVRERIAALKQQIESLKALLDTPRPSNAELIELGKQYHPYYTINRDEIRAQIQVLQAQIAELRSKGEVEE